MTASIRLVVLRPADCRVIDADLLGKPAGQSLIDALRACPGAEVSVADRAGDPGARVVDARTWVDEAGAAAIAAGDAGPARRLESLADLAVVEAELLAARARQAMQNGVRLREPATVRIRGELIAGGGVEIDADVIFEGRVVLGDGVRVGAHSILRDVRIDEGTRVHPYTMIERSTIGRGGFVGPYARIRPDCTIGDRVQIGNYVEIKASIVGSGGRINHHAFIGDAELAEEVTIGAGTITCNHDGARNTKTTIERGAYVGSGCNLVAPLRIGAGATIGAGSTITADVPPGGLTLARSRQIALPHWRGARSSRS